MDAAVLLAQAPLFAAELILALGGMGLLMVGVFAGPRAGGVVSGLAVVVVAAAGVAAVAAPADLGETALGGVFVLDSLARFAKALIALTAAAALVMSGRYLRVEKLERFEYPVLMVFAVLGMMIMASARDIITLYMGIELQSLALYVLAAYNRDSLRASEAGLKYFILGALSSGLLLYGASLTYGFTGATRFVEIAAAGPSLGLTFGLVFMICGLAFKISAAPFHMWTPDVYQGAPTAATAFFAGAPKLAAMVLLARTLMEGFPDAQADWAPVIGLIAAASMTVGSIGALAQRNLKRLMAYSSIANMGFALVALAGGGERGLQGLLVYMAIYVVSTTGVFACILAMRWREGVGENIDDLAGLARSHPGLAMALSALMFSIAGVPPLAGFFGKFFAFLPAWAAGLHALVIYAVLMSVVAAFYYLRIVKIMWFDEVQRPFMATPRELGAMAAAGALFVSPLLIALPAVVAGARAAVDAAAASLF